MSLIVREANLREERSALVDALSESLEGWNDDTKFDWLYLDNPFGEARCWVLVDEKGNIVGVSAAFPRVLRLDERELRAWVLGDFCVAPKLRSLGPAMKLQRAVFDAVGRGDVDLWYDFPSQSMMAVYQRMGAEHCGDFVRMVQLLRTDRAVGKRVKNPVIAKGLSVAGNALLASRAALAKRDVAVEVVPDEGESVLSDGATGLGEGIVLSRTSDYLNWRYRHDPRGKPAILNVSRGGNGSVVFQDLGDDVEIVDLFGAGGSNSLRELVLSVIEVARERDAMSVTMALSSDHPWVVELGKLGFQKRESRQFVVYAPAGVLAERTRWFLTSGDSDLY